MSRRDDPELQALLERLQAMPASMRERKQWLLWRFMSYEGDTKPRKVPFYASGRKRSGAQGSADDLAELVTFNVAMAQLALGHFDGMGFAFLPGDGLIGIDIDGAIDLESGEVSQRCLDIVAACGSYTEHSPSGKGVHIIVAGETTTFKDNSIGLEVFCGRQFFTCTGAHWADTPAEVAPISEATLRRLRATVDQARQARKPAGAQRQPAPDQPQGPDDFARVNAVALALLDVWVPSLFPQARKEGGTGAWRVRSRDLGRDLQEDLSLHPSGIRDFGAEEGLTPIDVVLRFKGGTAKEALTWLAGAVGMQLSKPQRKAKAKPAAASESISTPSPASGDGGGEGPPDVPESPDVPEPPDDDDGGQAKPRRRGKRGGPGEAWRERLLEDKGRLQDCRENVFHMLDAHPLLKGLVAFDLFSHRILKLTSPPWDSEPGEWTTNDDYELALWLTAHEGLVVKGESTIAAGVAMAAFRARFHPVKDWLNGLAWDGVDRLGHWLHECLGTADSTYHRMVGTFFLQGLVARVLDPGCQMDHMVVLEGGQGHGKSSALRVLAGQWFADTPIRIGDKDALLNLAGVLIYEVAELDSFNKAEVTAVKQYVSGRVDRVREPYTRRPVDRPRSCVLAGTTNQHEYFKDPTGSRRFWPVSIPGAVKLDKLREWREQLFAEAVHRFKAGERHYPTREEEKQYFHAEQDSREIVDPWFERIATWLDDPKQEDTDTFTAADILIKALYVSADRIDGGRQMATRVGIVMHRLGWAKQRDSTGARLWRYVRPKLGAKPGDGGGAGEPSQQDPSGGPTGVWQAEDWNEEAADAR